MSYRKRPYSEGSISQSARSGTPPNKRYKKYKDNKLTNHFESQDIWKNLDRVRIRKKNTDITIKNSCLFIPLSDNDNIHDCLNYLHKYLTSNNLQLRKSRKYSLRYVILKDFSLLDCCLVLSILFSLKDKKWFQPYNKEYFDIPKEISLGGSVYLPSNCRYKEDRVQSILTYNNINLQHSTISPIGEFKEINIKLNYNRSLAYFVSAIADFISSLKFGKIYNGVIEQFGIALDGYQTQLNLAIMETSMIGVSLIDPTILRSDNLPLLKRSNENMTQYINKLNGKVNNEVISNPVQSPNMNSKQIRSQNVRNDIPIAREVRQISNGSTANKTNTKILPDITNKPGYLSEEEIKEHCLGSIKASIELARKKSSSEIFKAYIRCPKHNHVEKIYQNLEKIRKDTNCNVLILHMNNIHESEPWLKSLDINKFSKVPTPPPNTVRVMSFGGINEYIIKALEMIYKIINS